MSDRIPECPHPDNEIIEGKFCWTCLKCRRAVSRSFYPLEFQEKFKITNVVFSWENDDAHNT